MNVIIHDLSTKESETLFTGLKSETKLISNNGQIKNCIGCFGCWIKTPGKCILKDNYEKMGEILSLADKVIIISRCCYGGYSPFVKNVLDRSISYLLPYFKIKQNETHHRQRYKKDLLLSVYFYGKNISKKEAEIAESLVKANSINFYVSKYNVSFLDSSEELYNIAEIQ